MYIIEGPAAPPPPTHPIHSIEPTLWLRNGHQFCHVHVLHTIVACMGTLLWFVYGLYSVILERGMICGL